MINKLGYIFSKNDKIKLSFLMVVIAIGSFLELMGCLLYTSQKNVIEIVG